LSVPPLPRLDGVRHAEHDLPTGVRLHIAEAGDRDAPAVVAVHGWPQHWWVWRGVIGTLARTHRVICPDLRGFGWSGMPADGDYTKGRLADDAVALLDVLGIERALLLGHDWGAWAGFLAATGAPERWSALVATGIVHPWATRAATLRALPRFAYQPPLAAPVLGPQIIRHLVPRLVHPQYGARLRDPQRAEAASRLYRDFLLHEAGRVRVPRLRVPTRLLHGTRDPLGTALALGLERHCDDARTELLDGCGHMVPEERPADVASAVRSLL
jgi:pimeloyl-ACP methyl ester carboxylesterase